MRREVLSLPQLRQLYEQELTATFPPEELKPLSAMEDLLRRGLYTPLGFYEDGALAAYALLWHTPESGCVLLDYLGVTEKLRGHGLGSQALRETWAAASERFSTLLLEVEAPGDPAGPEYETRVRRIRFYERCGCRYAGFDCALFGVHYREYQYGSADRETALRELEQIYRSQIGPGLYERVVQLPLLPGEPVRGKERWK